MERKIRVVRWSEVDGLGEPVDFSFCVVLSVKALLHSVCKRFGIANTEKARLWKQTVKSTTPSEQEAKPLELSEKVFNTLITDLNSTIEAAQIEEGQILLLEVQRNDGTWAKREIPSTRDQMESYTQLQRERYQRMHAIRENTDIDEHALARERPSATSSITHSNVASYASPYPEYDDYDNEMGSTIGPRTDPRIEEQAALLANLLAPRIAQPTHHGTTGSAALGGLGLGGNFGQPSGTDTDAELQAALLLSREAYQADATREQQFEEELLQRGFLVKQISDDGNCLFGAVADQVYGDPALHREVRKEVMDYIESAREHFSQFITEDFDAYVLRKRCDKVYGNNVEIQAICELYQRPVEVYSLGHYPLNTFQSHQFSTAGSINPIRLSYHRQNHYNSLVSIHGEPARTTTSTASVGDRATAGNVGAPPVVSIPSVRGAPPQLSSGNITSPPRTTTMPGNDMLMCPECNAPMPDFEELQVHMLTTCPKRVDL